MTDCEFCQVVRDYNEKRLVANENRVVAFLDEHPATRGHTLVVPKSHHESLLLADESLVRDVYRTVQRVANALHRTLNPAGFSTFYTSADLVGNVTHAHVHLIPRYENDDVHVALTREHLDSARAEDLTRRLRDRL